MFFRHSPGSSGTDWQRYSVKDRATSVLNYSKENLPAVVNDTLTHLKGFVKCYDFGLC